MGGEERSSREEMEHALLCGCDGVDVSLGYELYQDGI